MSHQNFYPKISNDENGASYRERAAARRKIYMHQAQHVIQIPELKRHHRKQSRLHALRNQPAIGDYREILRSFSDPSRCPFDYCTALSRSLLEETYVYIYMALSELRQSWVCMRRMSTSSSRGIVANMCLNM